jgi:hypothetical protein
MYERSEREVSRFAALASEFSTSSGNISGDARVTLARYASTAPAPSDQQPASEERYILSAYGKRDE